MQPRDGAHREQELVWKTVHGETINLEHVFGHLPMDQVFFYGSMMGLYHPEWVEDFLKQMPPELDVPPREVFDGMAQGQLGFVKYDPAT